MSFGMRRTQRLSESDFPASVLSSTMHDRLSRRRHAILYARTADSAKCGQRDGEVIPFGEVADHGGRILGAVIPLDAGTPLVGVKGIANHDDDRRPAAPGVVDTHGGML